MGQGRWRAPRGMTAYCASRRTMGGQFEQEGEAASFRTSGGCWVWSRYQPPMSNGPSLMPAEGARGITCEGVWVRTCESVSCDTRYVAVWYVQYGVSRCRYKLVTCVPGGCVMIMSLAPYTKC